MYLNVIQLAESFGVDEGVVDGWIRNDALPVIEDRGRLLFDRRQVVEWAASRGLAAKAGFLAPTPTVSSPGRRTESLLRNGGIWRDVPGSDLVTLLERIVAALPGATPEVRRILAQRLRAAGGITWTPVGGGLALPHLRSHITLGRDAGLLSLIFLRDALSMTEPPPDDEPVRRLLFFIAPSPRAHLELLSRLSGALSRGSLRGLLQQGATDSEIFEALHAADSEDRNAGREGDRS